MVWPPGPHLSPCQHYVPTNKPMCLSRRIKLSLITLLECTAAEVFLFLWKLDGAKVAGMSDKTEEENLGKRALMYHTDGRKNGHRKYSIIF